MEEVIMGQDTHTTVQCRRWKSLAIKILALPDCNQLSKWKKKMLLVIGNITDTTL